MGLAVRRAQGRAVDRCAWQHSGRQNFAALSAEHFWRLRFTRNPRLARKLAMNALLSRRAEDFKSSGAKTPCGFESRPRTKNANCWKDYS